MIIRPIVYDCLGLELLVGSKPSDILRIEPSDLLKIETIVRCTIIGIIIRILI
jgi:hypothetical protein